MWAHRKKVGIYKVGRETLTEFRDTETLVSGIQALYHYGNKFLLFKSKNMSWECKVTNIHIW